MGFKGSWLAIWHRELGADVIGYSLAPPSEPNNFEATRLREKITHVHGDIRDLDRLTETFKKYQPEFVFHLAAQPLVRLFSFISSNWRGELLCDYETIVRFIARTTTVKGSDVVSQLDRRKYRFGRKVSNVEMVTINLVSDKFHSEWNCAIRPREYVLL